MKLVGLGEVSHVSMRREKKGGDKHLLPTSYVPSIELGNLPTLRFFNLSITLSGGVIITSVSQIM